jgi:hypothetical protein
VPSPGGAAEVSVSESLSVLTEWLDVLAELPAVLVSELLLESSESSDIDRSSSTSECWIQVNTWSGRGMHSVVFGAVVSFGSTMAMVGQDINEEEEDVVVSGTGWFEHEAFEQGEG